MPAKEGLPGANVAVGSSHTPYVAVDGVFEDGVEVTEVPGARLLVHEGAQQVSAVQRRREDNILPKLPKVSSTISSTWSAVRSSVILSKTPIFSLYSLRERDFFCMCRHS